MSDLAIFGKKVLIVAPHADDAELGCGGLIARLVASGVLVKVVVMTMYTDANKDTDPRYLELSKSMSVLGVSDYHVLTTGTDGSLHLIAQNKIISLLDSLQEEYKPNTVIIPMASSHQDHKYTWEVCLASCRPKDVPYAPKLVIAYEYPLTFWGDCDVSLAYRGGLYVDISDVLVTKLAALSCYGSQMKEGRSLISTGATTALATMRGYESSTQYAELYHLLRMRV